MNDIETMAANLRKRHPDASVEIDPPLRPDGYWAMDVKRPPTKDIVVDWRPGVGFGVTHSEDSAYGAGPDEFFAEAAPAEARIDELLRAA